MYTITLSDGTKLEDLKLNGNNYISQAEVTEDTFKGKLSKVTIESDEKTEVLHDVEVIQISPVGEEYWFILREMTDEEKAEKYLSAAVIDTQEALAEVYEMLLGGMS